MSAQNFADSAFHGALIGRRELHGCDPPTLTVEMKRGQPVEGT